VACSDADGMTGTQDVMQGHGSDSRLNRGWEASRTIFDPNYAAFEHPRAPNKQKLRVQVQRQYITYAMATKKTMTSRKWQISISGFMYVCKGPNSGTIA
jgi:hypothetical protein